MRLQGRLVEWDDARGFGFVVTHGTEQRIFIHIKSFTGGRVRRPKQGDILTYIVRHEASGKVAVAAVAFAAHSKVRPDTTNSAAVMGFQELVVVVFGGFLAFAALRGLLPWWIPMGYIALSGMSFLFYRHDKQAARAGRWRTPESTLQMLALLGGWPGAWLAQKHLRHKSAKTSFLVVFWFVVACNLAGLFLISRQLTSGLR